MPFFDKFKKGTRSKFVKASTTVALPPPAPEPIVARSDKPTPADKDKPADEAAPLDETLVPSDKPTREKLTKPAPVALEGQANTEPATTSDLGENIHLNIWRSEATYRMTAEHYPETNDYTPSAIPLFHLLEAAERRINVSKHIQQHEPDYNPYAVKMYYAYMYYIQILRARREAGVIEGFENSLLKRFEVKYPMNTLPCAEIVYGYFSTIIATELAEAKYDWIVPRISIQTHTVDATTGRPVAINANNAEVASGAPYLQPLIPHMMAVLNTFVQNDMATHNFVMEDGDTFLPTEPSTAAGQHGLQTIFGKNIHTDDDDNIEIKRIMATVGLRSPMRFGNENYPAASKYAKRTDFGKDIKFVVNATGLRTGINLTHTYTYQDLDTFLMMPKTSTLRFFSYLKENAIIHARFHDKVYHFSDVQTTGGLETTVLCQLKLTGNTLSYTDTGLDLPQDTTWYPDVFRSLRAGFATNRAGLRRNEELQAFAYGTNANLPIAGNHLLTTSLRSGSFWMNTEWIQTLFHDDEQGNPRTVTLTNTGKPMYTDHNSVMLRCYREKPHGTGVVDNMFE